MSFSTSVSAKLTAVKGCWKSHSAILYFWLGIYQTSKTKCWIQAIYQVIKALVRSILDWFYWTTNTLTSIFKINLTLYSQYLTFFKAFKTLWYFCFIALYFLSIVDQTPLLYFDKYFFLSTSCISTPLHPSKLMSTAKIISPALLLYSKKINVRGDINANLIRSMDSACSLPYINGTFFSNS